MGALVIIGNGFDLAHGLKTGYSHFIEFLIELQLANPDLKRSLFDTDRIKSFLNDRFPKEQIPDDKQKQFWKVFRDSRIGFDYLTNKFLLHILKEIALKNWCDLEEAYFQLLGTRKGNPAEVKKLNKDFEDIKHYLSLYLNEQETAQDLSPNPSYAHLFKHLRAKSLILNFNYTNTLNLYQDEIRETAIIHLHGKLSDAQNPIIFGYAANDEESRALSNRKDNELMRNIKKHCYKRANSESRLNEFIKHSEYINVMAFGHSFGGSDKLILNTILNHSRTKSIRLFYYEKYESYFQMQANIDRVMINDANFEKLINFQDSHRMPQKVDDDIKRAKFVSYLENLGPLDF